MPESSEPTRTPPRLSVLLAPEAPVGVIFRRGPSKHVQIVMWNRVTDRFRPGQWFKGRIYADRSDISPDGRRLIYFAMGGVKWAIPATGGTWTAVSELPSLKALALWGQGDTWGGGGMFLSNNAVQIHADANTHLIRDDSGLRVVRSFCNSPSEAKCKRDGWVRNATQRTGSWEKVIRHDWILRRKRTEGYLRSYELEQPGLAKLGFPNWEWADWDRDRLVWAESGRLRSARVGAEKLGPPRTLFDFNGTEQPIASLLN